MLNLKNKYLLNYFNQNLNILYFSLICHSHYLTTSDINLLRSYCKQNQILCFNVKNAIVKNMLVNDNYFNLSNLFVSQNIMFNSVNFLNILGLMNELLNVKTKLIPFVVLYNYIPFVLTVKNINYLIKLNNCELIKKQLINLIAFLYLFIYLFCKKLNLFIIFFLYYANIKSIN